MQWDGELNQYYSESYCFFDEIHSNSSIGASLAVGVFRIWDVEADGFQGAVANDIILECEGVVCVNIEFIYIVTSVNRT